MNERETLCIGESDMAKSFEELVARTGNAKTRKIAERRTRELVAEMIAEIARLRLTDAEREALERLCEATSDVIDDDKRANGCHWQDDAAAVAVVRGLMERLK